MYTKYKDADVENFDLPSKLQMIHDYKTNRSVNVPMNVTFLDSKFTLEAQKITRLTTLGTVAVQPVSHCRCKYLKYCISWPNLYRINIVTEMVACKPPMFPSLKDW